VTCSASQRYSVGTSSPGQAFEQRLVSFEEPLGPGREVVIGSDPVDLCAQGFDDQLIDARSPHAGNSVRLVGQFGRESYGRLLRHDVMLSRYRAVSAVW